MEKKIMTKSYGNGFDHMESQKTFQDFIAWWNEKSYFPMDVADEPAAEDDFPMAA